jgi:hypothetical protein
MNKRHVILLLAIVAIIVAVAAFMLRHPAAPSPKESRRPTTATQELPDGQVKWELGSLADAFRRKNESFLKGLPTEHRHRLLNELNCFEIVAYDRTKPSTRPRGRYFHDDDPPTIRVFRRDRAELRTDLQTDFTKKIDLKPNKYVFVKAEIVDPTGLHCDDIWEKNVDVHFDWDFQPGKSISLGLLGARGSGYAWNSKFRLTLPPAPSSTQAVQK